MNRCIICDELFIEGFDSGKYFICHECEKKTNEETKPEAQVTVGGALFAKFEVRTCEIILGDGAKRRLLTDMNHEYMHFILQKNHGVAVSAMWDNVSEFGELDGVYRWAP